MTNTCSQNYKYVGTKKTPVDRIKYKRIIKNKILFKTKSENTRYIVSMFFCVVLM